MSGLVIFIIMGLLVVVFVGGITLMVLFGRGRKQPRTLVLDVDEKTEMFKMFPIKRRRGVQHSGEGAEVYPKGLGSKSYSLGEYEELDFPNVKVIMGADLLKAVYAHLIEQIDGFKFEIGRLESAQSDYLARLNSMTVGMDGMVRSEVDYVLEQVQKTQPFIPKTTSTKKSGSGGGQYGR